MTPEALGLVVLGLGAGAGLATLAFRATWRARLRRFVLGRRFAPDIGRPVVYGVDPTASQWSRVSLPDADGEPRAVPNGDGPLLDRARVVEVVLVHGTFVGDDPLALVEQWKRLLGRLDPRLGAALRGLTKQQLDRMLGDSGNFSQESVDQLRGPLGPRRPVSLFVWSSANHHLARLRAARDLALFLAPRVPAGPWWRGRGRILLVGHSHGGQVFALLTHLLAASRIGATLRGVLDDEGDAAAAHALDAALDRLRGAGLDLVTLGAPPRYGFCLHPRRRRALHVVNHRGDAPRGGTLAGALHTRDGDYIQQWGIAGSDIKAQTAADRELNRALDADLGIGSDAAAWLENVKTRPRVHRDGHTLLVDYGDATRLAPNFMATGLGHAVYTTRRALAPTLSLAIRRLYG